MMWMHSNLFHFYFYLFIYFITTSDDASAETLSNVVNVTFDFCLITFRSIHYQRHEKFLVVNICTICIKVKGKCK